MRAACDRIVDSAFVSLDACAAPGGPTEINGASRGRGVQALSYEGSQATGAFYADGTTCCRSPNYDIVASYAIGRRRSSQMARR